MKLELLWDMNEDFSTSDNASFVQDCNDWIHSLCIVDFDLEIGQVLEAQHPQHKILSDKEKANICYLAFPDSNSGYIGDIQYHFRVRHLSNKDRIINKQYKNSCPLWIQVESDFLIGFVFFRQKKNKNLKRGFYQKSLILLSQYPFYNLFTELMKMLAPKYFECGMIALENIYNEIQNWPKIVPGQVLQLPCMGHIFYCRVPFKEEIPDLFSSSADFYNSPSKVNILLPSLYEHDLFSSLQDCIACVQILWELVLTGQPVLVLASLPSECSNFVQALTSLIWPLTYSCEYRTYFTIHDTDLQEFAISRPPQVILGVTNPYFVKFLNEWPTIIHLAFQSNYGKNRFQKKSNRCVDFEPGLHTTYKPYLKRDKAFIKKIIYGMKTGRPVEAQSVLVRRYFIELTQSFIIPLERYMSTLLPLQKDIEPFKCIPKMKPFNPEEFLASLQNGGPQLTSKILGDWQGLYQIFFKSPNFNNWFEHRYHKNLWKLQQVYLQLLSKADITQWMQHKCEVEIIDLILKIKDQLRNTQKEESPSNKKILSQLQFQLQTIQSSLPDDLKNILKLN